eukprot:11203531-Lingulodinium_polyedra.AAC.1
MRSRRPRSGPNRSVSASTVMRGEFATSPRRAWKLRQVLLWVAGRSRAIGRVVEKLLGHCAFHFMALRPLLSVFSAAY